MNDNYISTDPKYCGKCKDCARLRVTRIGMSCKIFGNAWDQNLLDGYGCSQFFKPKTDTEQQ